MTINTVSFVYKNIHNIYHLTQFKIEAHYCSMVLLYSYGFIHVACAEIFHGISVSMRTVDFFYIQKKGDLRNFTIPFSFCSTILSFIKS